MPERIDEKVRVLNGGHRRRVEIVRALMHEPSVLLLDEATVGLDVPTRATIVDHVHNLASERGIAVLWATHLIDEIRAADDLIVLNAGQVIESGRVGEVVSRVGAADLAGAFHGLIEKDNLLPKDRA
jgi:ABC-2 type transport system ATP-binding protein